MKSARNGKPLLLAFDTVDHKLLINKLYRYGVRGTVLQWFINYISIGCCSRFGRGASLYRHWSQLFGRLWVLLPLPTDQVSEI